ncbi:MAG: hypothetical protein V4469_03880 [Patescibacteria group bacterium]
MVWFLLRLTVPHLGFSKVAVPDSIPSELNSKITEYNQISKTDNEFLRNCYGYVTTKYKGSRIKTITEFWSAFGDTLNKSEGFLPCTNQNYLLRVMLIKSGRFTEEDIQVIVVPLNFFIHQYLRVKADGNWIDVDPWSNFLNVSFGKKLSYFG